MAHAPPVTAVRGVHAPLLFRQPRMQPRIVPEFVLGHFCNFQMV